MDSIFSCITSLQFIIELQANPPIAFNIIMNNQSINKHLKQSCKEALALFLKGEESKLKQKLQQIHQYRNEIQNPQRRGKSGDENKQSKQGKFAYELNFEEQQQQEADKKKKSKPKPRMQSLRKSDYCLYCPDNEELHLLSASNFVYLAMPNLKTFRKYPHYIIAPVDHIQTRIGADQAIQQELKNYQKCLIQMLDKMGLHAIFLEQFSSSNSHIYIECIGIPLKKAYDLPFFFKQALENVEGFWTTHKRIIDIRKEKGGLQKQIPKQMKYFYIDFGLGYGYAHIIEDQKQWDRSFCYEIVAAALGMQSYEVKTTQQYADSELQLKSKEFDKQWKPFDWTVLLQPQKND